VNMWLGCRRSAIVEPHEVFTPCVSMLRADLQCDVL
jgi:hypothetical protein